MGYTKLILVVILLLELDIRLTDGGGTYTGGFQPGPGQAPISPAIATDYGYRRHLQWPVGAINGGPGYFTNYGSKYPQQHQVGRTSIQVPAGGFQVPAGGIPAPAGGFHHQGKMSMIGDQPQQTGQTNGTPDGQNVPSATGETGKTITTQSGAGSTGAGNGGVTGNGIPPAQTGPGQDGTAQGSGSGGQVSGSAQYPPCWKNRLGSLKPSCLGGNCYGKSSTGRVCSFGSKTSTGYPGQVNFNPQAVGQQKQPGAGQPTYPIGSTFSQAGSGPGVYNTYPQFGQSFPTQLGAKPGAYPGFGYVSTVPGQNVQAKTGYGVGGNVPSTQGQPTASGHSGIYQPGVHYPYGYFQPAQAFNAQPGSPQTGGGGYGHGIFGGYKPGKNVPAGQPQYNASQTGIAQPSQQQVPGIQQPKVKPSQQFPGIQPGVQPSQQQFPGIQPSQQQFPGIQQPGLYPAYQFPPGFQQVPGIQPGGTQKVKGTYQPGTQSVPGIHQLRPSSISGIQYPGFQKSSGLQYPGIPNINYQPGTQVPGTHQQIPLIPGIPQPGFQQVPGSQTPGVPKIKGIYQPGTHQQYPPITGIQQPGVQQIPGAHQQPGIHQQIPGAHQQPGIHQQIPGAQQQPGIHQQIPGAHQQPGIHQQIPGAQQQPGIHQQIPGAHQQPGIHQQIPGAQQQPGIHQQVVKDGVSQTHFGGGQVQPGISATSSGVPQPGISATGIGYVQPGTWIPGQTSGGFQYIPSQGTQYPGAKYKPGISGTGPGQLTSGLNGPSQFTGGYYPTKVKSISQQPSAVQNPSAKYQNGNVLQQLYPRSVAYPSGGTGTFAYPPNYYAQTSRFAGTYPFGYKPAKG